MNKSFIKLYAVALGVALASVATTQGATVVYSIGAGQAWCPTNLFTGPARITGISINTGASGGATNLVYAFNDFPGINLPNGWGPKQTNFGYMQIGQYTTNILKIQTNFGGVYYNPDNNTTNWITVSNLLWVYTNYVGLSSNDWRVIASGSSSSNSITTLALPSSGIPVIYGLGFTNNNIGVNASITITYNPSL